MKLLLSLVLVLWSCEHPWVTPRQTLRIGDKMQNEYIMLKLLDVKREVPIWCDCAVPFDMITLLADNQDTLFIQSWVFSAEEKRPRPNYFLTYKDMEVHIYDVLPRYQSFNEPSPDKKDFKVELFVKPT